MTDIVPVAGRALINQFVELPYRLYAGDPHFVPQLRRDERNRLDPAHNPFFEHATMQMWIAKEDGLVTGRIAAIDDRLHDETHGPTTWFGFFEARDHATAGALLAAVEGRAREQRHRVVRGPANPSLNESCGLLIDAFDRDPYALMPYNPPTYPQWIEGHGYSKIKDLFAWDLDLTDHRLDRVVKLADRVRRRHGVVVRTVDLKQFDRDLAILQQIYRGAWEDNWGFVAPTDAEMRQLAVDLKPVLDPELILFLEIQGRPVGCSVGIPDVNQVLKRMNGRLLPFGLIHFLRRRKITTQLRILLMGVLPEVRRIGLYPLLIHECHKHAISVGYTRAELGWTLEDNDAINAGIVAAGANHYKTYRMYEKALG